MRRAVETVVPVFGAIPRSGTLTVPSRHLGLHQASEFEEINDLLGALRDTILGSCDIDAIRAVAEPVSTGGTPNRLPPLGQRIAVARDEAFGFSYPHMLNDWREQGAEVSFFSPLARSLTKAHPRPTMPFSYPAGIPNFTADVWLQRPASLWA